MFKNLKKIGLKNFASSHNSKISYDATRRVMSTNSWPIPYYNRQFKAYPYQEKKNFDVDSVREKIDDLTFLETRQALQKTAKGRQILNEVEHKMKRNSYVFEYTDIAPQANAYVAEMAQFIDVAHKENKRILETNNLI